MKKSVIFSIFILGLLIFLALFASFIAPYDPQYVDVSNKLLSPSPQHLLGTDQLGRDVFSRLLYRRVVSGKNGRSLSLADQCLDGLS